MPHTKAAEAEAVGATSRPGRMHFPQTWIDEGGERLEGYRIGNGLSLLVTFPGDGYCSHPELRLVSDVDARLVQARHWIKQSQLFTDHFEDAGLYEVILRRDIWEGITLLPMPETAPPELWAGEQESREAEYARLMALGQEYNARRLAEDMGMDVEHR